MMKRIGKLMFIILFLAVPFVANASVWYVKKTGTDPSDCNSGTSWETAFATIQQALECAQYGDEIWVAEGVYFPSDNGFQLKENVALYGGFSGDETSRDQRDWESHKTILSGDIDHNDIDNDGDGIIEPSDGDSIQGHNAYRVLTGANGARIDGVVVTAGDGSYGGGLHNESRDMIVANSIFVGNKADHAGGAIYNSTTLTILNTKFLENESGKYYIYEGGGAIYNYYYGQITIKNSIFTKNKTTEIAKGGAIDNAYYARLDIDNCKFEKNSSYAGGAICFYNSFSSNVRNSMFIENSATLGAGIYNDSSWPDISNSVFIKNMLTDSLGSGSAIYDYYSFPTIINCSFIGHSNSVLFDYGAGSEVINSIFWDNINAIEIDYSVDDENDASQVEYSDIRNGFPGEGNIDEDPMFVDPENGDLHLKSTSPCIDSGNNDFVPQDDTDFEGEPRIMDGDGDSIAIVDMGADEFLIQTNPKFLLNIKVGDGNGSITSVPAGISCGEDCSESYEEGTQVTLTATPSEGFSFAGWNGDCAACGNDPQCTITMDADKTCTANFEPVSNEPPVIDSFTAEPNSGDAPLDVTFTCEAHDNDGQIVSYGWDFDGDGTVDETSEARTISHTYQDPGTYQVRCTVTDNDGDSVTSESQEITVNKAAPSWVDITDTLNITHSTRQLYDRIHRCFFIQVTVENPGEEVISGPVRLVITNPSIPVKTGVGVGLDPDGYTDDGDPYFIIVPEDGTLDAGGVLRNLRINFELQRARLTYGVRVEQLTTE